MISKLEKIKNKIADLYVMCPAYVMYAVYDVMRSENALYEAICNKSAYKPDVLRNIRNSFEFYSFGIHQKYFDINNANLDEDIKILFDALYEEVIVHIPDVSKIKSIEDGVEEIAKEANSSRNNVEHIIYSFFHNEIHQFNDLNKVVKFKKEIIDLFKKSDDEYFEAVLNKTINYLTNEKIIEIQSNESKAV